MSFGDKGLTGFVDIHLVALKSVQLLPDLHLESWRELSERSILVRLSVVVRLEEGRVDLDSLIKDNVSLGECLNIWSALKLAFKSILELVLFQFELLGCERSVYNRRRLENVVAFQLSFLGSLLQTTLNHFLGTSEINILFQPIHIVARISWQKSGKVHGNKTDVLLMMFLFFRSVMEGLCASFLFNLSLAFSFSRAILFCKMLEATAVWPSNHRV